MILWENYISSIPNAWCFRDVCKDAHFMFDAVMRNVSLNIGIDKVKLNRLMNRDE